MLTFRELNSDDAEMVLKWRTKERITRYMSTDIDHDIEAQEKWLHDSFSRTGYYHWIIQYAGKDIGFINISNWNSDLKETFWGYYIGDDSALGIGGIVPPCLYKFAFDVLGVESVKAAIIYSNVKVIQLHTIQGYKFEPSKDYLVNKNGTEMLMVCMSLEKKIFLAKGFNQLDVKLPITKWTVAKELMAGA